MINSDVIFFIGRSGAGKGTQAKALAQSLDFFYWEMGGILRAEIAKGTEIGKKIADLVNGGVLLSDQHMYPVIEAHLHEIPKDKGIIFDGFPRRISQANYIMGLLRGIGRKDMTTLYLDVPREDSVERLHHRAEIEHRVDDTDEVIEKRLDQFETETAPVLDYLETMTKFYRLDGRPPIEEVRKSLHEKLGI
jgi:adenylate kinase